MDVFWLCIIALLGLYAFSCIILDSVRPPTAPQKPVYPPYKSIRERHPEPILRPRGAVVSDLKPSDHNIPPHLRDEFKIKDTIEDTVRRGEQFGFTFGDMTYVYNEERGDYDEVPFIPTGTAMGKKRNAEPSPYMKGWTAFDVNDMLAKNGEELARLCPYPKTDPRNIEWWAGWYSSGRVDWRMLHEEAKKAQPVEKKPLETGRSAVGRLLDEKDAVSVKNVERKLDPPPINEELGDFCYCPRCHDGEKKCTCEWQMNDAREFCDRCLKKKEYCAC